MYGFVWMRNPNPNPVMADLHCMYYMKAGPRSYLGKIFYRWPSITELWKGCQLWEFIAEILGKTSILKTPALKKENIWRALFRRTHVWAWSYSRNTYYPPPPGLSITIFLDHLNQCTRVQMKLFKPLLFHEIILITDFGMNTQLRGTWLTTHLAWATTMKEGIPGYSSITRRMLSDSFLMVILWATTLMWRTTIMPLQKSL